MSAPIRLTAALSTVLGAIALVPVIRGTDWLVRCMLAVALVAATGHGARLLRAPSLVVPLVQLGALALLLTAMFAGRDAVLGMLPGEGAVRALIETVVRAVETINSYAAPVPGSSGVLLLVVAGIGVVAVLVDLLAVGLGRPALAGLPLLAVYSVPAATLSGGVSGLLFLFPAAGFLALLLAEGRERLTRWGRPLGADGSGPRLPVVEVSPAAVTQLGRRIGVAVLGIAAVLPAMVPLSEGILAGGRFGQGSGGGTIATLNPLVSLRRDLVRPRDVEVMWVQTDAENPRDLYFRTVTLDVFDGQDWRSSSRRVQRFDEQLPEPPGVGDAIAQQPVRSAVQVTRGLESDYLPLPYPARRLVIDGDWRVDPATQNIVSHDGRRQISGTSYTVESALVNPRPDQLDAAAAAGKELDRYRRMPRVPPQVRRLAEQVTADAETPFAKALAIQDWLRDPENFTYDLRARPGTGTSAILDFLTERRGYCEQFASTMAVFARLVGLPARVNVGFTSGDLRPDGLLAVSAHDAHAWPEVYLTGVGWMRFEPTPPGGSASPSLPSWLTSTAPGGAPVTAAPAPGSAPPATSTPTPRAECPGSRIEREECLAAKAKDPGTGSSGGWPARLPVVPITAVVLAVVLAVLPATLHGVTRRRRWARADDAVRHAEAAWAEVRDAATDLGYGWDEAQTPRQAAARLTREAGLSRRDAEAMNRVTRAVERARYSGAPDPGADLRPATRLVQAALAAKVGRWERLRARLFPRSSRLALHRGNERAAAALVRADRALGEARRRFVSRPVRRLVRRVASR